ncbi:S9 family peptidase [Williamsia sp. CHRR-6]|uniref:alpha/beta hydrolase family protein n=1 Tax=Williamsia sp. CHRR-6 TaxID=2835871 RepID=UPI001BDA187E|nr:alpha/beta fold hydrolase [Williamsia sp. CHRR-6]MBT0566252.1 alpha/beta fold hydrolase [Williamsia sp. CHRR-6]
MTISKAFVARCATILNTPLRTRTTVIISTVVIVTAVMVGSIALHQHRTDRTDAPRPVAQVRDPAPAPSVRRFDYLPGGDRTQDYGDLYLPAGEHRARSVPLVVLIHGGGWTARFGADTVEQMSRVLAARGRAVFTIEYRRIGSGGGWPTTFSDVAAALNYVPTLGREEPAVNIDDAVVVGHSAGAQLAVWAATRNSSSVGPAPTWRPARVVSLAGPLDMTVAANSGDSRVTRVFGGSPTQVPERYRAVDPAQNLDPGIPITVVHGTADTVVSPSQATTFTAAARAAGVPVTLVLLRGRSHSALVTVGSGAFSDVLDVILGAR